MNYAIVSTSLLIILAYKFANCSDETEKLSDQRFTVFNDGGAVQQDLKFGNMKRYLLYDVNHSEGFNLRRDVYMRMANLVRQLQDSGSWTLVLPPWGRLYHWRSNDVGDQIKLPWSHFFNTISLGRYVPVMELDEFIAETGLGVVDKVFSMQYFADTFKEEGIFKWEEKYQEADCLERPLYYEGDMLEIRGPFWGYDNLVAINFTCLSLQGQTSTMAAFLRRLKHLRVIMLDRAEIILHDGFGDATYWKVRRSMRFAQHLIDIADKFRLHFLNSSDLVDRTETTEDWRTTKKLKNSALGGPYLAVHLRRQDFLYARTKSVPSLRHAAKQINSLLTKFNLSRVFVATDAPETEFAELKLYLPDAVKFEPTPRQRQDLKDGGLAIIDQWICAHARHFIGTSESTFSFRIQEEREILGFAVNSTFNRLCGDEEPETCDQPTRWQIVY